MTVMTSRIFAILFIGIFLSLGQSTYAAVETCPDPASIKDFITCQNRLLETNSAPRLSDYIAAYADAGRLACTRSGASAQPAFPDQGDLRCFLVFKSRATVSFNIVEGTNRNHIEVSEPAMSDADDDGVLLAFFLLNKPIGLAEALGSSSVELNDRGLKCSFCHQVLGNDQIMRDGIKAWVLTPIKLNSTVRETIPRNGQIAPELLDKVLKDLYVGHACEAKTTMPSETCMRLSVMRRVKEKAPLDNP